MLSSRIAATASMVLGAFACFSCSTEPTDDGALGALSLDASPEGGLEDAALNTDAASDGAIDCRVATPEGGVCACTEIGQHAPTLYLLLDRSGSMGEMAGTRTKWSLVRASLFDEEKGVLRRLGGRINVAAATFPGVSDGEACAPGKEVFPVTRGSKATYDVLASKLASFIPRGATPTAESLRTILPKLAALPPPVYVLLATDGAPNCGVGPCAVDRCGYNVEKAILDLIECDTKTNCCDPTKVAQGLGWKGCIDDVATNAVVSEVVAAGAKVFVLGVPGSSLYARDLDAMAIAGGVPREGPVRYYAAKEPTQDSLVEVISAIASRVVDTCDITLDTDVPDPGVTNVLTDGELVAFDAVDGWRWTSTRSIGLAGKTCAKVMAGKVSRIQVVVGCKTITR